MIGHQNSATGSGAISSLLLAGHQANVLASTVTVGRVSGSNSGNAGGGEVTFDNGSFDGTREAGERRAAAHIAQMMDVRVLVAPALELDPVLLEQRRQLCAQ